MLPKIDSTDIDNISEQASNADNNLEQDILILENVNQNISDYAKLGVQLGNALEQINTQKENIKNAINNSVINLEHIVEQLQTESNKIINDTE